MRYGVLHFSRLQTLTDCDMIVALEGGKVEAVGSPQALLSDVEVVASEDVNNR